MTDIPEPYEEIDTLADVTRFHAKYRPDHLAARFEGRETTYGELDERTSQIANALAAEGLKPGDRAAYLGKNSDEYFELFFGCQKAGVVIIPVGWRLAPPEVRYIVDDCHAKLLFVGPELVECAAQIESDLPHLKRVIAMETPAKDWPAFSSWYGAHPATDPHIALTREDAALQLYTSGTTGNPKGAQLSHGNFTAARVQMQQNPEGWNKWTADDVSLVAMPVAHIGGTGWGYQGYYAGALNVIAREFDPHAVLDFFVNDGISKLFMVPAAIQIVLQQPNVRDVDFSCLKYMLYGASPIPLDLLREAIEVFQCGFCQQYGMTETTGTIVYLPPEDHVLEGNQRMRGAGKPFPHVELRVRRTDGTLADTGEIGEVETRSNHNMLGYWNLAEASKAAHTDDGWLKTGDAGYLDEDGYLYIQDRVKDMIVSGAENVYPAEVESAIYGHPDIAEVAVIGVPDEKWGEAVKAFVVPKPGTSPDPDDIIDFTKTRIAAFKAPKSVDFIEALPRNPSGKILRKDLRAPYWEGRERQVN
ncbi:MAG: fatty acid--CoA ligase [Pacificimonas sp.]|nr:fatty acid--CoA ligase [Pacificimonas sp.]